MNCSGGFASIGHSTIPLIRNGKYWVVLGEVTLAGSASWERKIRLKKCNKRFWFERKKTAFFMNG
jgi:hypothetical protein